MFNFFKKQESKKPIDKDHEPKIILFDLDGTIIDSLESIYESFVVACGEAYSPLKSEVQGMIGMPLLKMFRSVGFSESEAQDCVLRYKRHYQRIYLDKTKLLPEVTESIVLAKSFAHLGVVTSKTSEYSKKILENFRILKHISVVIGNDDVDNPKPDAEPILKALEHLPITPKDKVFMIGDTIYDLDSAKNAGVNGVWLKNGFGKDLEHAATYSFPDLFSAVKYIKEI